MDTHSFKCFKCDYYTGAPLIYAHCTASKNQALSDCLKFTYKTADSFKNLCILGQKNSVIMTFVTCTHSSYTPNYLHAPFDMYPEHIENSKKVFQ